MEKPKIENYKLGKGFHTQNFVSDLTLYADQLEAEIETHSLKNESKLRVLLSNKIEALKSENKELIESIEALLILIDPRLHLIDGEIIGKGKSIIWKRVVKTAQDLIKQK